ncbi:unnamed protein product [Malus baccata var. baccata]
MALFTRNLVLVLFLLTITLCDAGISIHRKRRHVRVKNFLQLNGTLFTLTLHCKSKDDDLGKKVIPFNSSWEFDFIPHFLGATLFFCGFAWPGQFKWFNVYNDDRDIDRASKFQWSIYPPGPCRVDWFNESIVEGTCYHWNGEAL